MEEKPLIELLSAFRANVETVLLGKRESVDLAIASFIAGGHVLLEDVPGTGKTTLARALSSGISGPSAGSSSRATSCPRTSRDAHPRRGPEIVRLFARAAVRNVVLADEITGATRGPRARCWRR